MGAVKRIESYRGVQARRPQHVGEHVWFEPLVVFLRRKIWTRPDRSAPDQPVGRMGERFPCRGGPLEPDES